MTALLPLRFPCPEDRYWIDDLLNAILLKPAASYMCVDGVVEYVHWRSLA